MDIVIRNLSYTYQPRSPFETKVLDQVNLTVGQGQWVGIVGKTGSGKSTLVQHMNGLLTPTAGTVQIGDTVITNERKRVIPLYEHVGIVFQYPEHQLFEETVYKDIAFGPGQLGLSEAEIDERVQEVMSGIGLPEDLLQRSPFDLSGGQKRKVAIAGVLVMEPQVLILDEPTAGLDPYSQTEMLQLFQHWQHKKGSTIILITHQMDDIAEYAEKVIVVSEGKVKGETDPLTLFTKYSDQLPDLGLDIPRPLKLLQQLNQKLKTPIQPVSTHKKDIYAQLIEAVKKRENMK